MPRISCTPPRKDLHVRLSFKERRIELGEATEFHRKSGMWGTQGSVIGTEFKSFGGAPVRFPSGFRDWLGNLDWPGVEMDVGEFFYGAAQGLFPTRVHLVEFGIVVLKAPVAVKVQPVVLV